MASYNKFNAFVEHIAEKVHNLEVDTLKVMLVNSPAPVATNSLKGDLTEISAGNGYTAGGTTSAQSSSAQASGTYKLVIADVVFTAGPSSMAALQYAVLYNDTPSSPLDPLIAFWNYGSSITLLTGETFTTDFDATNGVLQIV